MKALFALLLLAVLAAGAVLFLVPYGPHAETFVDIPMGTGSAAMGASLEHAGILRSRVAFTVLRRLRGGTLHAGEYRFDHPATPAEVYARIVRGDVYTRTLVVPEGFNSYDIAAAVERAELGSAAEFLAATRRDTAEIAAYAPGAASVEGYLFPDTYRFSRHAGPDRIVAAMVRRFRQAAAQLNLPAGAETARVVTLASLVEKEVAVPAERPLVAGVFANRLRAGMPLATDPSVAYAALLDGRWTGVIHRSDLAYDSLYNTYLHAGLPPGPIASPGMAALRAALAPAATPYLYFVADAQGHSTFAATLDEHNRNVAAYRKSVAGR